MMPHQKFLFATGCVAQVTVNRNRTTVTLYRSRTEIMALHGYFTSAVVDEILGSASGSEVRVLPKAARDERLRGASSSLRVDSRHAMYRLPSTKSAPHQVPNAHRIDDGCFYWLLPTRGAKKKAAVKHKK